FLLIPGLQIAGAALLALPFRANVPVAAAMTFLSNPATTPLILAASYYIGSKMLGRTGDMSHIMGLLERHAGLGEWTRWLLSEPAPVLFLGPATVSIVVAMVGYLIAPWPWRGRLARRWGHRSHARAAADEESPPLDLQEMPS